MIWMLSIETPEVYCVVVGKFTHIFSLYMYTSKA